MLFKMINKVEKYDIIRSMELLTKAIYIDLKDNTDIKSIYVGGYR